MTKKNTNKKNKLKLKLLEKDNNFDGIYYIDQFKRMWVNIDNKIIKPKRFDIYAHICKINNMKSNTQIYNSYDFINENTLIIFK